MSRSRISYVPFIALSAIFWFYTLFNFTQDEPPRVSCNMVQGIPAQNQSSQYKGFPRKLWQTSRTYQNPGNEEAIESWLVMNPGFRYERITQLNDEGYVREKFSHRPKVVDTIVQLRDGMLRADLIQYIFLFLEGGAYTDLDTRCLKPIDSWVPDHLKDKVGLVIGIEGDCLGGDLIAGFSHCVQFATWTLMVKPGHFIVENIMNHVVDQVEKLAIHQNTTIPYIKASYMDVMDTTGPGVYSATIYKGLSDLSGTNVTPQNFTDMEGPKVIGDVLILPITSFAAGIGHSKAGSTEDPTALVHHQFMGSWKGGREMETSNNEP